MALSSAYHPQTNEKTEHYNQELETYLCIFCEGQPQKRLELLPMAEFACNAAIHLVTNKSPFSLIMRYEPWAYPSLRKTFLPALKHQLNQIEDTQKEAEAATNRHSNTWESEPSLTSNPRKLETKSGLKPETSNFRYPLGNSQPNELAFLKSLKLYPP